MGKSKLLVVYRQGFTDFANVNERLTGTVDRIYEECEWDVSAAYLKIKTKNGAIVYYPTTSLVKFVDITHEKT